MAADPKSTKLEKDIAREYKRNHEIGLFLTGTILGIFGGFTADLFKDLFIGQNRYVEILYLLIFGSITFGLIWFIDHRAYGKVYKLEKELKRRKKK